MRDGLFISSKHIRLEHWLGGHNTRVITQAKNNRLTWQVGHFLVLGYEPMYFLQINYSNLHKQQSIGCPPPPACCWNGHCRPVICLFISWGGGLLANLLKVAVKMWGHLSSIQASASIHQIKNWNICLKITTGEAHPYFYCYFLLFFLILFFYFWNHPKILNDV